MRVQFQTENPITLLGEVPSRGSEQARGLMLRKNLPRNQCMVFFFQKPGPQEFWMKNTYLPLDIIFVDKGRRILNIEYGHPLEEEGVRSKGPAKYVIETNAGFCQQYGIKPGCRIRFLKDTRPKKY